MADESFEGLIVTALRRSGYQVGYIAETNSGASDDEVLKIALATDSVVLTNDLDFGELAVRLGLPHRGILILRLERMPTEAKGKLLLETLESVGDELKGKLAVLTKRRLRVRKNFLLGGNGHPSN